MKNSKIIVVALAVVIAIILRSDQKTGFYQLNYNTKTVIQIQVNENDFIQSSVFLESLLIRRKMD